MFQRWRVWCWLADAPWKSQQHVLYIAKDEGDQLVSTAKMGSSIFPLCLTLLLCSVYGSPVSVSKTWFLQSPLSPVASHTLYWLYSILFQVGHLSSEAGKCCVSWFEFWSISFYLLWVTTSEHFVLTVLQMLELVRYSKTFPKSTRVSYSHDTWRVVNTMLNFQYCKGDWWSGSSLTRELK